MGCSALSLTSLRSILSAYTFLSFSLPCATHFECSVGLLLGQGSLTSPLLTLSERRARESNFVIEIERLFVCVIECECQGGSLPPHIYHFSSSTTSSSENCHPLLLTDGSNTHITPFAIVVFVSLCRLISKSLDFEMVAGSCIF